MGTVTVDYIWRAMILLLPLTMLSTAALADPFCFRSGITWESQVSGGVQLVTSPEMCQLLCEDSSNCNSVTWYNSQGSPRDDYCELFPAPHLEEEVPCNNCVSGPQSCTCSSHYECALGGQLVDLVLDVSTEMECAKECYNRQECLLYTWYSEANPTLQKACALMRGCDGRADNIFALSGPSDCTDAEIPEDQYPLCYTGDHTWAEQAIQVTHNITDPYTCQELCHLDQECSSFTWYSSLSTSYPNYCEFYPGEVSSPTTACTNCVSGQSLCTCSTTGYGVCDTNKDRVISAVLGVNTEVQCQDLCARHDDCTWYTWYPAEGSPVQLTCFLLSSCNNTLALGCDGCYSGPQSCDNIASIPLPVHCTQYRELDSFTGNTIVPGYKLSNLCGSYKFCSDVTGSSNTHPDWSGDGYYRFTGAAGTRLAESGGAGSLYAKCGTVHGGYLDGGHPGVGEGEVSRTVYFDNSDGSHFDTCTRDITVTSCGEYFVYKLSSTNCGYCGTFV